MIQESKRKKIALYGGSFDPPHYGHVTAIKAILNSGLVDEIWLIPTGVRIDKKNQASNEDRKSMISLMLSSVFGERKSIFMNTTQIDNECKPSTTFDLVEEMKKLYPSYDFSFVIGADLISAIPTWHKAEKLMQKDFFLLVPRLGEKLSDKLPDYVTLVPTENIEINNISSSMVRKLIAEGKSLDGIVPPSILLYIKKEKLYLNYSEMKTK